jgi:hypothetical protein
LGEIPEPTVKVRMREIQLMCTHFAYTLFVFALPPKTQHEVFRRG